MEKVLLTVDAVVFSVRSGALSLLLIRRERDPFKGSHALPGGYVEHAESLEDAVKRELAEETGVKDIFLRQLKAYGEPGRDPRGHTVSVAFLALISADHALQASEEGEARWFPVDGLPKLAFDHAVIVKDALEALRFEIQTTNIALEILPKRFTLSELQSLYESVLGKSLDKRNFRRRIQEIGLIKPLKETRMEGAHRPAQLFSFSHQTHKPIGEKATVFI